MCLKTTKECQLQPSTRTQQEKYYKAQTIQKIKKIKIQNKAERNTDTCNTTRDPHNIGKRRQI
jgi:hypothetical protein